MESGDLNGIDHISHLPESLISYLLSFLPTKFAVSTSILSKSWRFRWTQLTAFDFDDKVWRVRMNFVECVNMVLQRAESITKISLKCHRHYFQSVNLNAWVETAIARNVQVFYLSICHADIDPNMEFDYYLSSAFYTCGALEVLKLQGPIVIQVPNSFRLANLTDLELDSVVFGSDDSIDKLVSASPRLQSLKITRYHYHDRLRVCCISSLTLKRLELHLDRYNECARQIALQESKVKIDAPALETLVLHDDMVSEISIQGVLTSVNEVELDLRNNESTIVDHLAISINRVKFLTLSKQTMNAICEAPNRLSTTFDRLTKLVVEFEPKQWSCLLDLIDRCIKLEVLDIRKVRIPRGNAEATWADASSIVPRCFSWSLKRVSFRGFEGVEDEMQDEMRVLEFILNHCLLIEGVDLWYDKTSIPFYDVTEEKRLELMNKVSLMSKASPTCEISFSGCRWEGAERGKTMEEFLAELYAERNIVFSGHSQFCRIRTVIPVNLG